MFRLNTTYEETDDIHALLRLLEQMGADIVKISAIKPVGKGRYRVYIDAKL